MSFDTLHEKTYYLFFFNFLKRCSSQKIALVFEKKCTGIWFFSYYQEGSYFFFPKIRSYSLEGKWKIIFLQKIHGITTFSVYSVTMIFSFPTNMVLHFFQKKRMMTISQKIRLKMTFLVSLKNIIFILENMVFLMIE